MRYIGPGGKMQSTIPTAEDFERHNASNGKYMLEEDAPRRKELVELIDGEDENLHVTWHYVHKGGNGQVKATSETYRDHYNAMRAAAKEAHELGVPLVQHGKVLDVARIVGVVEPGPQVSPETMDTSGDVNRGGTL